MILNTAKAEIKDQVLDSTKALQRLGWTSRFALGEGLHRTVDWYRELLGKRVS